ncbi:MAG: diguanylate cyclase [Bacillota bacterium]
MTELIEPHKIKECQDRLSAATGVCVSMRDDSGQLLAEPSYPQRFCQLLRNSATGQRLCATSVDMLCSKTGDRFRVLSSRCHAGLLHFAAPVLVKGSIKGYIVAGGLAVPGDEQMLDQVASATDIPRVLLEQSYSQLLRGSHEEVTRITSMIEFAAWMLSDLCEEKHSSSRKVAELEVLNGVSVTLSSILDIDAILPEIIRIIKTTLKYLNCAILLVDDATNELVLKAHSGYERADPGFRIKIGERGVTGWAAMLGEPVIVPDVSKDPRYIPGVRDARSEVAVPLVFEGKVIGVLDVESEKVNAFGEEDVRILTTVGGTLAVALRNAQVYKHLKKQVHLLGGLADVTRTIVSTLDTDKVLRVLIEKARLFMDANISAVHVNLTGCADGTCQKMVCLSDTCDPHVLMKFVDQVYRTGEASVAADLKEEEEHTPLRSVCAVPIKLADAVIGCLVLGWDTPRQVRNEEMDVLRAITMHGAIAIANSVTHEEVTLLSLTDSLTGLGNRRYMEQVIEKEICEARLSGRHVSLAMLDIDDFKKYNDKFGHLAGDKMLESIGRIMRNNTRDKDVVCRYGGEEFALIFPGTPAEEAEMIVERIMRLIEERTMLELGQRLTVSAGIATFPTMAKDAFELLERADAALYLAKSSGKNRVVLYKKPW